MAEKNVYRSRHIKMRNRSSFRSIEFEEAGKFVDSEIANETDFFLKIYFDIDNRLFQIGAQVLAVISFLFDIFFFTYSSADRLYLKIIVPSQTIDLL